MEEQAAFVDAHARGLDATIAAMSSLQDDTCAHFRVGHADASDGLDDTEQALQRQATEGSIALLSQESDLRRVGIDCRNYLDAPEGQSTKKWCKQDVVIVSGEQVHILDEWRTMYKGGSLVIDEFGTLAALRDGPYSEALFFREVGPGPRLGHERHVLL